MIETYRWRSAVSSMGCSSKPFLTAMFFTRHGAWSNPGDRHEIDGLSQTSNLWILYLYFGRCQDSPMMCSTPGWETCLCCPQVHSAAEKLQREGGDTVATSRAHSV